MSYAMDVDCIKPDVVVKPTH